MLTDKRLKQMFEDYYGEVLNKIDTHMTLLSQSTPKDTQDSNITEDEDVFVDRTTKEVSKTATKKKTHRLYIYEDRM